MHLSDDELLLALDDLNDSLAATRAAIEAIAANHLGFAAQLRVQRASTQRARRLLQAMGPVITEVQVASLSAQLVLDVGGAPSPDETDEVLRRTLGGGTPLDVGPEEPLDLADDPLASLDLQVDDDQLEDEDSLVQFTDDDREAPASGEASYVVFEEDDDAATVDDSDEQPDEDDELLVGLDDDIAGIEDEDLVFDELDGDSIDPDSASDVENLVSFGDEEELVTLGGDAGDVDLDVGIDSRSPDEEDTAARFQGDATLVTDLESLVRLQDMIHEDEGPGAAHSGEGTPIRPEPRVADPVRVTTTLTDDDLDRLGFSSTDQLVAPEGADADPNSETGSRPAIRIGTPDRPDERADNAGDAEPDERRPAAAYTPPRGASVSIGASLPTIRDQQPGQARPTAAAIRIDPSGGGRAVAPPEEEEALALGGAPDDEEVDDQFSEGGFSLDVEEYELVEDEDVEEDDSEAEAIEPAGGRMEPAPMPTISADQETRLLRQAQEAYDRGDLSQAADLFSDLLDFNPDNGLAALGRGRVYLDLGDYARAMSDFTVAEDLRDDDPDVHAAIGELFYARKDYQRAIDYFDEALERNDRHAMAWCRRGIAHYYRKDYDRAYKDLVKAQKLDDAIPNIRTYIAMVKKKRR